jgi:gamma-glutamyltranspeptidase / glutathione hydrolase
MLAEGGNAIDAAVAGVYASCMCEPTLTGPGGAGFATVHTADGTDVTLDFFAAVPGLDRTIDTATGPVPVDVLFGATTQTFHVGPQSCAVPGFVAGTLQLHERFGRLPLATVLAPAIELARTGIEITAAQAYCHSLLERIVTRVPAGKHIFSPDGRFLAEGDRFRQPDMADTFEQLVSGGAAAFYTGDIAAEIVRWSDDRGGLISRTDLERYRVAERPPVHSTYRGIDFLSVPPPSSGGTLIAFTIQLLERARHGDAVDLDSPEGVRLLVAAMLASNGMRGARFDSYLYGGGLEEWLLGDDAIEQGLELLAHAGEEAPRPSSRLGSTTHLSTIDSEGNAVAITTTTGCGSGEFAGATGVHLNNMMGEEDLLPVEHTLVPGQRLTSMMSPSIMLAEGRPLLATGSAGSNRIRSAIIQSLVRLVESRHVGPDRSLADRLEAAVQAPRLHAEIGLVHAEPGIPADAVDDLRSRGHHVNEWPGKNLYFGGVNMVATSADEGFAAAADRRRGGGAFVVQRDGELRQLCP